ncbi:hypothetical protein AgCh_006316 [Apium graveolens]
MDTACSSSSSSSSSAESVMIEALIKRGWCFGDIDKVKALIVIQCALHGEASSPPLDLIESQLCNMDFKSIGAKSLPDSSVLRSKFARLQGPKVLQVSAARDISRSIIAESSGNSSNKRLLRLKLTDGHSEITAIEFSHIPSIPDDVVPGTKIRFEDKAVMRNGILCLNPKVITVLGGVVQSLFEEWQMNQKYSGFSRTSVQLTNDGDTGGPPQFEKLHVGAPSRRFNHGKFPQFPGPSSKSSDLAFADKDGGSIYGQSSKRQHPVTKVDNINNNVKSISSVERNEGKVTTSSESRPKEVVELIPVQNQAAAQKLLEKMSHNARGDRFARGGKYRGKGKYEAPVLTLDEWEKRKASANSSMKQGIPDVRQDEDLARQLQNQFDLEDHEQRGPQMTQADAIKLNMFSFAKDNVSDDGRTGGIGRGRGRGRGSGRARGRGFRS